jgi:fibronectin-binding autotransporter adhesin
MKKKYPASFAALDVGLTNNTSRKKSGSSPFRCVPSMLALMACAGGVNAHAASLTWDGGPSTAGVASNGTDWGTAANWRDDTAFSNGDSVLFTTVGNTTVAGVTSGVTTSGSTIMTIPGFVLAGVEVGQAITGTNIQPGTYIAAIINSNTIQLSQTATGTGSGSHVIANTGLPNPTTINLGANRVVDTLTFNNRTNSFALTLGSAADISNGYTLTLSNVNLTQAFTTGLTLASKVNLVGNPNGQSSWRDVGGGSSIISGAVSSTGSVALVKSGTNGTLTLSGANTFSGSLQVEVGTLNLTGSNTYTGTTTASGGTLGLNFNSGTAAVPASNIINSGSSLVLGGVRGGGTVTVTGKASSSVSQSFNGTTINSGASTLNINNSAAANTTRTLVNLGAITRNVGGTVNFVQPTGTGNTTPASDNGYTTTTANDASGILGGYATVGGTDWATNNGTNIVAYTGYTADTWSAGTNTNVTASNTITNDSTTHSLRFNTAAATTLTLGGTNTITSGGILVTSTVGNNLTTITGGTLRGSSGGDLIIHQNNTGNSLTIASTIADNTTATALTKSGSGNLNLTGTLNYTGGTFVNAGTLTLAAVTNQLSTGGAITVAGGTLAFGGAQTTTGAVTLANGTISGGTLTNNGSALDARNGTISTTLAGSAGINKTTGGTLTLSNTVANTFAGDTVVAEGNLVASSSVISIAGNLTVGTSGGGSAAAFTSSGTSNWAQGKTLTVYGNGTVNFGNNAQNLSATSTLNIIGGSVNGASISNNVSTTINLTGGTLTGNFTGAAATYNVLASSAVSTIGISSTVGNQTFNVDDGAAATDLSYIGTLGGAFGITKNGAGLMAATSNSSYTGVTTINAGTLSVLTLADGGIISNLGSSTSAASNLLIRDGATLRYTGSAQSTDRLFTVGASGADQSAAVEASGTGAINFTNTGSIAWGSNNQTRTLKLGGSSTANNTLSALIADNGSGAVSLTKQGVGKWVLANTNTYTGATSIEAGRLALAAGGSIDSASALSIGSAATFDVSAKSAYALGAAGVTIAVGPGSAGRFDAGSAALTFGNGLTINFSGSSFASSYHLFDFGSQSGDFSSVTLTGSIVGSLMLSSADTWTGDIGGFALSFSEATGTLSVSSVPEPSTYAAISGVLVLAIAGLYSRRHK